MWYHSPAILLMPFTSTGRSGCFLVHRQIIGPAVDLPRAGEDDADLRVVFRGRLPGWRAARGIDLEVGVGIVHRVQVAGLAGEIEEVILAPHQVSEAVFVAHVGDVDAHVIFDAGDVEQVAAVFGNEAVDERDLRAVFDRRRARFEPMNPSPPVISTRRPLRATGMEPCGAGESDILRSTACEIARWKLLRRRSLISAGIVAQQPMANDELRCGIEMPVNASDVFTNYADRQ